jgi:hypothetical protein
VNGQKLSKTKLNALTVSVPQAVVVVLKPQAVKESQALLDPLDPKAHLDPLENRENQVPRESQA